MCQCIQAALICACRPSARARPLGVQSGVTNLRTSPVRMRALLHLVQRRVTDVRPA